MRGDPIQLPIACSLDAEGLGAQAQRWAQLVQTAGTGRAATPDGVELRFRPGDGVQRELERLIAVERRCCAWACWDIAHPPGDDGPVMRARAPGDGAAVLRSMFLRDE